jgi:hypothetical protein
MAGLPAHAAGAAIRWYYGAMRRNSSAEPSAASKIVGEIGHADLHLPHQHLNLASLAAASSGFCCLLSISASSPRLAHQPQSAFEAGQNDSQRPGKNYV